MMRLSQPVMSEPTNVKVTAEHWGVIWFIRAQFDLEKPHLIVLRGHSGLLMMHFRLTVDNQVLYRTHTQFFTNRLNTSYGFQIEGITCRLDLFIDSFAVFDGKRPYRAGIMVGEYNLTKNYRLSGWGRDWIDR
ncbi:MAG: hypothetical protein H6673_13090 [Anaerolineales bacterium]|nr:hypothetical protein [Anaerolineales bacterium]